MIAKVLRRILVLVYLPTVILFLAACFSPLLNPTVWWPSSFLGLIFPYLLLLLLAFLVIWIFARSRWSILTLLVLLLGWKNIAVVFAFHPFSSFQKEKKDTATLRIMTWNLKGFYPPEENPDKEDRLVHLDKMFNVIRDYDPDVIALQEFATIEKSKWFNNIARFKNMGYHYYFFPGDFVRYKIHFSGTAIFSKYAIIDSAKKEMPQFKGDDVESLLSADIVFFSDTIRVFTGHLQSYRFMASDYSNFSKIRNNPEERIDASKSVVRKMKAAFQKRSVQTDIIRKELDGSVFPEIFCGDLNDVPNSYAYFSVRNNKRDAFIAKGFGFGQTFFNFSSRFMRRIPTLRIDYIFTDRRFEIEQCIRIPIVLSDHIPVVADLTLKTDNQKQ